MAIDTAAVAASCGTEGGDAHARQISSRTNGSIETVPIDLRLSQEILKGANSEVACSR